MGGRRFVEGLYQALFSFRLARRNVIFKAKRKFEKIEPDLRLLSFMVDGLFATAVYSRRRGRFVNSAFPNKKNLAQKSKQTKRI